MRSQKRPQYTQRTETSERPNIRSLIQELEVVRANLADAEQRAREATKNVDRALASLRKFL
jgi:hypothetical protein